MGWFTGIVVFVMVWWTALFLVLPFGHVRDQNGTSSDPKMKQKLLWTTALTVLIWVTIYILVRSDIISFRIMAEGMFKEDGLL